MTTTSTKTPSFFGCLCRPQHPDDTGVAAQQRPPQSTRSVEDTVVAPSGKPPPMPVKASKGSSPRKSGNPHARVAFVPKNRSDQQIPMIPSPPSDDATPVMNNLRKRGSSKKGSSSSLLLQQNQSPPESLLAPSSSSNGDLKMADDDNGLLFTNASSDSSSAYGMMKGTISEDSNGSNSRKSRTSYYPNHVQDNIKVMRDYYEHAFTSSPTSRPSLEDATETTEEEEDITESTTADEATMLRVDCHEDPFESAYVVWYQKGLLKWRPKSMPHRDLDDAPSQFTFATSTDDDAVPNASVVKEATAPSKVVVVAKDETKAVYKENSEEPHVVESKEDSTAQRSKGSPVFPPSTPTRIRIYQEEVSRSSSLQKTRQAPLISVFGSPPQRRLASY